MSKWTQERDVPRLRYQPARDPGKQGSHYIWEGAGFGARVFATGQRRWVQCGTRRDLGTGKRKPYFFAVGDVATMKLADARSAAGRVKADAKQGIDPRQAQGQIHGKDQDRQPESAASALADMPLRQVLQFYLDNRNCAPTSKTVLASCLRKNLADWLDRPLLTIDATMLQTRYREIMSRVKGQGLLLDARNEELSPEQRLLRAPTGYRNGVKTAHDTVEGFGRIYTYWVTKHMGRLQQSDVIVPQCPTSALIDDLIPQPQRVKGVPIADLRRLVRSFRTYDGNQLHPLLARLLLASGARVGVLLNCKPQYVHGDRIVIPADAARSKVRWNKRHLEHMAKMVPITPEIEEVLKEIRRVSPQYGDAKAWLFPSRESKSGHMEEERAATIGLRRHAKVRFTLHQFRHNVASAAEELGYSKAEIAELLGHTTGSVTDRYIDERIERQRKQLIAIAAKLSVAINDRRSEHQRRSQGRAA